MAQERLRLLLGALAACLSLAAHPADKDLKTPQTRWSRLSTQDRQVLAPLAPDWEKLPGYQQQRLKSAARKYPDMRPIQQERFQERIRDWAAPFATAPAKLKVWTTLPAASKTVIP